MSDDQASEASVHAETEDNVLDDIAAYPGSAHFEVSPNRRSSPTITLCQAAEPYIRCGVDCGNGCSCQDRDWSRTQPIPWQALTQGEYVGPARSAHVPEYRVRAGDQLEFIYRRTREMISTPYRFNVGDKILVESMTDETIRRELEIRIDGKITLPPSFQVQAAGRTVDELTAIIEERYKTLFRTPAITVTPIDTERRLQDLLFSVDSRFGSGGLNQQTTVTPEGTIQLPGIGNVHVNGLSLDETRHEVEQRYANIVLGIGVDPRLTALAPHFIYVGGEVRTPNRYEINTPTTAIMAVTMAGGWNFGANLREIVVLRRAEDWRLIATKIDLHDALLGRAACPDGNIFLRDSDIVYLAKGKSLLRSDFLDLFFTKGLYRVIPLNSSYSFNSLFGS
jgi:polysaccharide export outer membrane protein